MKPIDVLENLGIEFAAISDCSDGDGATPEGCHSLLNKGDRPQADLFLVNQVHGTTIIQAGEDAESADGIITNQPGKILGIRVADCVPVWLLDTKSLAVGLFHAGRIGTFHRIAALGMDRLSKLYGSTPADVIAYIGPSAGPCCYEVDQNMANDFSDAGFPVSGRNLDLWGANRCQLEDAGLRPENIFISNTCTICTPHYHSYRRTRTAERNLCVVSI